MRINLQELKKNPYRDTTLYPMDEDQIQRLELSIDQLGFFAGVTARPSGNGFELAAGHHRIEAARRAGLIEVEAIVDDYDDLQMVQIMSLENLTQRGHNAASTLDSVAAYSRILTKQILLGEGLSSKFLEDSHHPGTLARVQQDIVLGGPGMELLYRAMNGFPKKERRAKKEAELITSTEIDQTLGALKAANIMGRIVAEVHAEVEAIRAERAAAAEAEAVATVADAEERAVRRKAAAASRKKEREAVKQQVERVPGYDIGCLNVFRLTSHEAAFRAAVLSENGRRFIPVGKQLDLAKQVRGQIDQIERKRNHDLGSVTIKRMVFEHINEAITKQREIDAVEKQRLLAQSTGARIHDKWKQLASAVIRCEGALKAIADEEKEWHYDAPFPMNIDSIQRMKLMANGILKLAKSVGV